MANEVKARPFQFTVDTVSPVFGQLKILEKGTTTVTYSIAPVLQKVEVREVSAFYARFKPMNLGTGKEYEIEEIIQRVKSWQQKHWNNIPWSGYVIRDAEGDLVGVWDLELTERVVLLSAKIKAELLEKIGIAAWGWTTGHLLPTLQERGHAMPSAVHVYMRQDHPFMVRQLFDRSGWKVKRSEKFPSRFLCNYSLKS